MIARSRRRAAAFETIGSAPEADPAFSPGVGDAIDGVVKADSQNWLVRSIGTSAIPAHPVGDGA